MLKKMFNSVINKNTIVEHCKLLIGKNSLSDVARKVEMWNAYKISIVNPVRNGS